MSRTTEALTNMGMYFVIHDLTLDEELYDSGAGLLRDTLTLCEQYNIDAPFFDSHDFNPNGEFFYKEPAAAIADQFAQIAKALKASPELGLSGFSNQMAIEFFEGLYNHCIQNPNNTMTCYTVY